MSVRFALSTCCLLLHLGRALPAAAEEPVPGTTVSGDALSERYRTLINEALTNYEEGRFVAALALFERAHALRPNARAMRGIALVLFELGDHARALRAVDAALSSDEEPLTNELREQLLEVRRRAAAQVERIVLQVAPAEAHVRVDGREVPRSELATLWLGPGEHRIETTRPGFVLDLRVVEAVPGGSRTMSILLTPAPPPREEVERARRRRRAWWGTAATLGLLGTSAAVWLTIDSSHRLATCRAGEREGGTCVVERDVRRERTLSLTATVLGAGLTVAASFPFARALARPSVERSARLSCALAHASGSCHAGLRW